MFELSRDEMLPAGKALGGRAVDSRTRGLADSRPRREKRIPMMTFVGASIGNVTFGGGSSWL